MAEAELWAKIEELEKFIDDARRDGRLFEDLPHNLDCDRDYEAVLKAYERGCNNYIRRRLTGPQLEHHQKYFFMTESSIRFIRDHEIKELGELLREDVRNKIHFRCALNALRDYVKSIDEVREALGLPEYDGDRSKMEFYYGLGEKVAELTRRVELIARKLAQGVEP